MGKEEASQEDEEIFETVLGRVKSEQQKFPGSEDLVRLEKAVNILREMYFDKVLHKIDADLKSFPDNEDLKIYRDTIKNLKRINSEIIGEKQHQTRVLSVADRHQSKLQEKVDELQKKVFIHAEKAHEAEAKFQQLQSDISVYENLQELQNIKSNFISLFESTPGFREKLTQVEGIEAYTPDPGRTKAFSDGEAHWWGFVKNTVENAEQFFGREYKLTAEAESAEQQLSMLKRIVEDIFKGTDFINKIKEAEDYVDIQRIIGEELRKNCVPVAEYETEVNKRKTAEMIVETQGKKSEELPKDVSGKEKLVYDAITGLFSDEDKEELDSIFKTTDGIRDKDEELLTEIVASHISGKLSQQDSLLVKDLRGALYALVGQDVYETAMSSGETNRQCLETMLEMYKKKLGQKQNTQLGLLKQKLTKHATATKILIRKRDSYEAEITTLKEQIAELQQKLEESGPAEKTPESLGEELARLEDENALLQNELDVTKAEHGKLAEAEKKYKAEQLELWSLVPEEIEKEIAPGVLAGMFVEGKPTKGDTTEIDYETLKEALEKIIEQRNSYKQELEKVDSEIKEKDEKIRYNERKMASLVDNNSELEKAADEKEAEIQRQASEIRGLECYKEQYEKKCEEFTGLEDAVKKKEEDLAQKNQELDDYKAKEADLVKGLAEKEDAINQLEEKFNAKETKYQELLDERNKLAADYNELETERNDYKEKAESLEQEIKTTAEELEEQKSRLSSLEDEKLELELKVQEAEKDYQSRDEEARNTAYELQELKEKSAREEDEREKEKADYESKIAVLNQNVQSEKSARESVVASYEDQIYELNETLSKAVVARNKTEEELSSMRALFEEKEKDYLSEKEELEKQLSELHVSIAKQAEDYENDSQAKKEQISELVEEVDELKERNESLAQSAESSKQELGDMQEKLDSAYAGKQSAENENQSLKSRYEQAKKELEELTQTNADSLHELNEQVQSLTEQNKRYAANIDELSKALEEAKEYKTMLEDAKTKMQADKEAYDNSESQLHSQIDELSEKYASEIKRAEKAEQALNDYREKYEVRKAEYIQRLKNRDRDIARLKEKIDNLQKKGD